jgi:hypothetical protein
MPPWGCDREQGGSAPNAVKNCSSPFQAEGAWRKPRAFGELLIFAELQFARGRQLLTFLNLNPILALLNGATRARLSKLQIYLLTVCARTSRMSAIACVAVSCDGLISDLAVSNPDR